MASASLSKGTRKTYSFEEREILVNLIAKYLSNNEAEELDGKGLGAAAGTPGPKRKSVWSQLTEEYNSLVGPESARSSIQLRRCWENMKANKKSRDDKRDCRLGDKSVQELTMQLPPASALGLPPNVVFQPKDSEPYTFEGLMVPSFQCHEAKRPYDFQEESEERPADEGDSLLMDDLACESSFEPAAKRLRKKAASPKKPAKQKTPKPSKAQKNNELYEYSISEAQLKLETAALMKEEARLKLEEAEYKKEEARMRMICASYELQKVRDKSDAVVGEDVN